MTTYAIKWAEMDLEIEGQAVGKDNPDYAKAVERLNRLGKV